MRKCRICISPLRQEIEFLISSRATRTDMARKYHQAFNTSEVQMYVTISRHIKKKHPPIIDPTPVTEQKAVEPENFETYAKKLLVAGIQNFDPLKVKPQHIISAQRALIEEKKVTGTLDNQKLALMRMFRGKITEGEVLDATGIDATGIKSIEANTD